MGGKTPALNTWQAELTLDEQHTQRAVEYPLAYCLRQHIIQGRIITACGGQVKAKGPYHHVCDYECVLSR